MKPDDTFTRSLWAATAPPPPATGPLADDAEVDVAIVGGGLAGVSAALAAARAGASVQLLEAAVLGHGASGRSGGLVVPAFAKLGPAAMATALGVKGEEYVRLVGHGADALFGLVRDLAIRCDAQQAGWILPAHRADRMRALETRAEEWRGFGRNVELLDAAETARRTGSRAFHGALLDPTGGWVNPLALVHGLAAAAIEAGAGIATGSRVTALTRTRHGWRLATATGSVEAGRVLLAVNGRSLGLAPRIDAGIVPLTVFQSATPPLRAAEIEAVLPARHALADTRMNLFSARPTGDGRLITGGMAIFPTSGALDRMQPRMLARLKAHFPGLAQDRFGHAWSGVASLTGDFVPRLQRVGPQVFALSACNGRGIVANVALGQAIGRALATVGNKLEAAMPLPVTPPAPRMLAPLLRWVPGLLLPVYDRRDRR